MFQWAACAACKANGETCDRAAFARDVAANLTAALIAAALVGVFLVVRRDV